MYSHILTTGFVTRGQAEQSFRALGNTSLYKTMRVGLDSITKFMRKNPGFKTGELSYKTEDEAEITLWGRVVHGSCCFQRRRLVFMAGPVLREL